jgi:hypothetical protein
LEFKRKAFLANFQQISMSGSVTTNRDLLLSGDWPTRLKKLVGIVFATEDETQEICDEKKSQSHHTKDQLTC